MLQKRFQIKNKKNSKIKQNNVIYASLNVKCFNKVHNKIVNAYNVIKIKLKTKC